MVATLHEIGSCDVLVNNAAFTGTSGVPGYAVPFDEQTDEAFGMALALNLTAPFSLTRQLSPLLRSDGRGSVINVSSIYGLVGPNLGLYEGTRMGNPAAYAARSGTTVYDGYVQLEKGSPGTSGLTTIPPPDLSNPAGGAVEPQHFAYIVQWYLFAALALAAPFAMMRAERRERGADEAAEPDAPAPEPTDEERRAAKLADRYGRPVR